MEMERLVKGGKSEAKIAGPLFPRLHVDDTKKIGPRAPPRNKMALYDQLSIPSQRVTNTPLSTLAPPPPPVYGGRMITGLPSSSQGVGIERVMVSPRQKSHVANHSTGRKSSTSYERVSDNTNGNPHKRSITTYSENMNSAEGQMLDVPNTFLEPCDFSQLKWRSLPNDESELRCPTFVYPQMSLGSSKNQSSSKEDKILVSASCSLEQQTTNAKKVKTTSMSHNPESERSQLVTISNGDEAEVPKVRHKDEKTLHSFPQGNEGPDKFLSTFSKIYLKPLDLNPVASNIQNHKGCKQNQTDTIKAPSHMGISKTKATIVNNASILRSELCNEFPITNVHDHHRTHSVGTDNEHDKNQTKTCPVNLDNLEEDHSQISVKDCSSRGVITPDVVVEMIGHKQFWKAREQIIQ
ncbi:hypothetical protein SOVF_048440 [Spinacia oleracea]|nr:hypothetical protein SOVF_048440 [Spinacia oleracea]